MLASWCEARPLAKPEMPLSALQLPAMFVLQSRRRSSLSSASCTD